MINIDSRLLDQVTPDELFLLCIIANRIGKNGEAWPGNELLLRETGWHIEKLLRVKKRLEALGMLKVNRSIGRSNRYSITCDLIGNYVNGKTVVVGESNNGESDNGVNGKTDNDHYGKSGKEVLISEELINDEELTNKYLSYCVHALFSDLVNQIFFQFKNYSRCMAGYAEVSECKKITDPTIRKSLEKILGAARAIHCAFVELKRPLPEWRETSSIFGCKVGEIDPLREARDQISAYADLCRLTKTWIVKDPEKLSEKLIQDDWCKRLLDYAKPLIEREQYDPGYDQELQSQWLIDMFYYQGIDIYICQRYSNRIVYGGEEYLRVDTPRETIKRKHNGVAISANHV